MHHSLIHHLSIIFFTPMCEEEVASKGLLHKGDDGASENRPHRRSKRKSTKSTVRSVGFCLPHQNAHLRSYIRHATNIILAVFDEYDILCNISIKSRTFLNTKPLDYSPPTEFCFLKFVFLHLSQKALRTQHLK